ncbi:MAG: hypothetical protein V1906_03430 [Candidatus Woesearchaeota archaeon]
MLYNNVSQISPREYEARKAVGLWDYKAYEEGKHLIDAARQSFVSGVDKGKLQSLCGKYGVPVEIGEQLVEKTSESVLNLAFYESDRVHYHMLSYEMIDFNMEMVVASMPEESRQEVQVYAMQLLRIKKEDESDLEKLMYSVVGDVFTLADVENVKRQRFGDAKTYIDYNITVMDLTLGLCDAVERAQKDNEMLFMGEFFREFTERPYREMYVGVHTLNGQRMFPIVDNSSRELAHGIYGNPLSKFERKVVGATKSLYGKLFGK